MTKIETHTTVLIEGKNRTPQEIRIKQLQKREQIARKFLEMKRAVDLCRLVKEEFNVLQDLINAPNYMNFSIPKRSGGKREISAPDKRLLRVQKKLNRYLQMVYLGMKPTNVHGFVLQVANEEIQANIVENAKLHVGKRAVLNVDLENFFPSISAKRIKELFVSKPFNFNDDMATVLALLTTHKGRLPQGAPTSPVLSNFICIELDHALQNWSDKHQVNYSRYADDLTFSSDAVFSNDQITDLRTLIQSFGLKVNEKKLRQRLNNRKQTVTGITVNKKVNVNRRLLKIVRAMLHDVKMNGIEAAANNHFLHPVNMEHNRKQFFINRLAGSITFIGQVRGQNDPLYCRMKAAFDQVVYPVNSQKEE